MVLVTADSQNGLLQPFKLLSFDIWFENLWFELSISKFHHFFGEQISSLQCIEIPLLHLSILSRGQLLVNDSDLLWMSQQEPRPVVEADSHMLVKIYVISLLYVLVVDSSHLSVNLETFPILNLEVGIWFLYEIVIGLRFGKLRVVLENLTPFFEVLLTDIWFHLLLNRVAYA